MQPRIISRMTPRAVPVQSAAPGVPWTKRLIGRWWRRQTPARQDRFATLAPLVSVLLFLAAIVSAFWTLRNEEFEREAESVKRDAEIAQQQIRLRLIENQEQVVQLARQIVTREIDADEAQRLARSFGAARPEVLQITWLDALRRKRATYASPLADADAHPLGSNDDRALNPQVRSREAEWAFIASRDTRQPVYSRPFKDAFGTAVFQTHVPLLNGGVFAGALIVEYSIEGLLRHFVPPEVARRRAMSVLDEGGHVLASTVIALPGRANAQAPIVHDVPFTPSANGVVLRGAGYRTSALLIGNTLFWMVLALSGLTLWMLLGTWRHMRRRAQIQSALVQETNFRRAMENSMLTGMRAMDLEGRISYVNPAFCAMTGFSEPELIGRVPPYPHWPPDRVEENSRLLQQELQGRSPAGGIEVRVMRKDGVLFDARMYVSPLIDPRGKQTGWMTSMTNITEAKRIRDQLSASHERFTTVLEGLDAAVSVLSVQQGELLFANRSYRLWFGADARGHSQLASGSLPQPAYHHEDDEPVDGLSGLPAQELTKTGADPREVYIESLNKWFDVRSRYLQWTDGRLAQMLIATDVTARRRVEEQAAHQAEKAQVSSRLITMGEMASSVAHELNQPLTAITNYCNGMISRVRGESIGRDDLVQALEKTSRQAERAGQIIQRIRAFVRKSVPQRQSAQARQIVEDALELASIELRRRNVTIHSYVAQRLPDLEVDPILIEQVLLNLVRNAAEAIDSGQMPSSRRFIELRVVPRHTPEEGGIVEFSVTDTGPGLPDEVIGRLYEAFFSTKAEGLGIGLSLCRSIVESHRGRIRAQNLYNGAAVSGCRFAFSLPVEIPQHHAADASGAAAPGATDNSAAITSS
jgi:PAS domain S-box-containing protein